MVCLNRANQDDQTPPLSIDHALAADLLAFLDASPSPWHAVAVTTTRLAAAGFASLDEGSWSLQPGGRYYVVRGARP